MDKLEMLRSLGFSKEVENRENGLCAFCSSDKTNPEDFKSDLCRKEHSLSGLCQKCQDEFFD